MQEVSEGLKSHSAKPLPVWMVEVGQTKPALPTFIQKNTGGQDHHRPVAPSGKLGFTQTGLLKGQMTTVGEIIDKLLKTKEVFYCK